MSTAQDVEHGEFVQGYTSGTHFLSFDPSIPLQLTPKLNTPSESFLLTVIALVVPWTLWISAVVLTVMQKNAWFLLAFVTTILGQFQGGGYQRPIQRGCSIVSFLLAIALVGYAYLAFADRFVLFISSLSFLVAFVGSCLSYSLAKKAFIRKLLESQEFFESAKSQGIAKISLD